MDIVELIESCSADGRAVVVGHDWGAVVAYVLALRFSSKVSALISLCTPYVPPQHWAGSGGEDDVGTTYRSYFQKKGPADEELSRDVALTITALFRLPHESLMSLDRIEKATVLGGIFVDLPEPIPKSELMSDDDFEVYKAAFLKTGFTGALSWYRNDVANRNYALEAPSPIIELPTLMISAGMDPLWPPSTTACMAHFVPNCVFTTIEKAGHWIQQQCGDQVASIILDWLNEAEGPGPHIAGNCDVTSSTVQ